MVCLRFTSIDSNRYFMKSSIRTRSYSNLDTFSFYILRWLALLLMLADHIVGTFFWSMSENSTTAILIRIVGRAALPLFYYCLVESLLRTKHHYKHLQFLFILLLLSELPFDYCFHHAWVDFSAQNICFTLFLGFLVLWIQESCYGFAERHLLDKKFNHFCFFHIFVFLFVVAGALLMSAFHVDYICYSMMMLYMFYLANYTKHRTLVQSIGIIGFLLLYKDPMYLIFILDILIIYMAEHGFFHIHNQKVQEFFVKPFPKQCARWFYPVHLWILAITKMILKIV